MDDRTGAIEKIASLQGSKAIAKLPANEKMFYFVNRSDDKWFQVTRWDPDTQQETVVVPPRPEAEVFEFPSWDGRLLFRIVEGDSISVRSMPDGDWKTLVSGVKGLFAFGDTTHDGNWTFYSAHDATGKSRLFRISTSGGDPQRIGDLPVEGFQGNFYLSPDERQILGTNFNAHKYDLWILENFEPKRQSDSGPHL